MRDLLGSRINSIIPLCYNFKDALLTIHELDAYSDFCIFCIAV